MTLKLLVRNFENHWTGENSHHHHLGFVRLPLRDFMMTLRQPHTTPGLTLELLLPLVALRIEVHGEALRCSDVGQTQDQESRNSSLQGQVTPKAGQGRSEVEKVLHASSIYQSAG